MKAFICTFVFILSSLFSISSIAQAPPPLEIGTVWSGHPVPFALLTHAPYQYAAYYDANRHMVVASRKLDEETWEYKTLPESVVWDSHNYITMAMDDTNRLHLSGNMHGVPLVYFRTANPFDIQSFERIESLVGTEEDRMTYPRFFRGPQQEFIFTYRDGGSGNGNQLYNVYDAQTQTWERLLDKPLTDGEGKMNAYISGPRLGPDGRYHCVWVWRDTGDCATNHHISYMRSSDLRNWENVAGEALTLPITIASPGTVVDPVLPGDGLINVNATFGFDADKNLIVTYHKYDEAGNSQVYNARWENKKWNIVQATRWDTRWDFSGGGTIVVKVRVSPIKVDSTGTLTQDAYHWELGQTRWALDPQTLAPLNEIPIPKPTTSTGSPKLQSAFPGMIPKSAGDLGKSPDPSRYYTLRWETLGANRDRPREKPWQEPSKLMLYTHYR